MKTVVRGIIATNLNRHCPALFQQPGQWSQPVMEVATCPVYHAKARPVKSANFAGSGNLSIASRNPGSGTNTSALIAARLIVAAPIGAVSVTAWLGKSAVFVASGNRLLSILRTGKQGTAFTTTATGAWPINRGVSGRKTRRRGMNAISRVITAIEIADWKRFIDTAKRILKKSERMTASATKNATRPIQLHGWFTPMRVGHASEMPKVITRPTNGASSARSIGIPAYGAAGRNLRFNFRSITLSPYRRAAVMESTIFSRFVGSAT